MAKLTTEQKEARQQARYYGRQAAKDLAEMQFLTSQVRTWHDPGSMLWVMWTNRARDYEVDAAEAARRAFHNAMLGLDS